MTARPTASTAPKTDAAIRDFEQAAGLRPSAEPNEALLAAIARSTVKAQAAPRSRTRSDRRAARAEQARDRGAARAHRFRLRPDQADRHPTTRETRAAIERFERERKLPVTGQITERWCASSPP